MIVGCGVGIWIFWFMRSRSLCVFVRVRVLCLVRCACGGLACGVLCCAVHVRRCSAVDVLWTVLRGRDGIVVVRRGVGRRRNRVRGSMAAVLLARVATFSR